MKQFLFLMTLAGLFFTSCKEKEASAELKNEHQKFSYSVGMDIARNMQASKLDSIDPKMLAKGIEDVLMKKTTLMSETEGQQFIRNYLTKLQQTRNTEKKAKGEEFLKKNAKVPGVVTTASGLQYMVIKEGTGPKPKVTDMVTVHYHGTLLDSTVFDSSVETGRPASFPVGGVIAGWTEALQLMPVGSKWKLFIPSSLAYQEQGAGNMIGPNETLIFEVELLSIDPPAKK